jgi:hypothetical protein
MRREYCRRGSPSGLRLRPQGRGRSIYSGHATTYLNRLPPPFVPIRTARATLRWTGNVV